jgi:hypothetical protein
MKIKNQIQKARFYISFFFTGFKKLSGEKKKVYIELLHILPNRRMLTLIRLFSAFDYICVVRISARQILHMDKYGWAIAREKNIIRGNRKKIKKCNIILSDDPESFPKNLVKDKHVVKLNYDVFNSRSNYANSAFFPIAFHPDFLFIENEKKASKLSSNKERKIAVFFAGAVGQDDKYNQEITKSKFNINTRKEVFSYIVENLPKDLLYLPESYNEFVQKMNAGELKSKVVLIDIDKFAVPRSDYFMVLSEVTFFIQMCGYIQPFCHNQIESLAVGAVPITQFPHIFHPNFEHEKNALVFSTLPELIQILEKICNNSYSLEQIELLQMNSLAYYKNNLSFKSVVNGIENKNTNDLYMCSGELN